MCFPFAVGCDVNISLNVCCRFFCGPNAKKSDALAKQQKKRPRAGEAEDEDDSDFEDEEVGKKGKKAKHTKTVSFKKGKEAGKNPVMKFL